MTPRPAIEHFCRPTLRPAVRCGTLLGVMLAAACSSAPPPSGTEHQLPPLSKEQAALCRDLERAYREQAADYALKRDALAEDPVAIGWITRMFIRDILTVREGRPLGEDQDLLRAAAGIANPTEARAIGEIEALSAVAVPTLVGDLLQHSQPQMRELGIELLARVGRPAVPALRAVARGGDSRHQRAAARALGWIGQRGEVESGEVYSVLRDLALDKDFTVRADALRGLRSGGTAGRDLVLERLQKDADPFVRRVAVEVLAHWRDASTVHALTDYLEQAIAAGDSPGELAAQAALQKLAGTRGPRTPAAWRAFAGQLGSGG
jgi:hypothetical protein